MKILIVLATLLAATPALADVGHLAEGAGHAHWMGAAAAAAAIAIAVWAGLTGRPGDEAEDDAEETADKELQGA